MKHETIQYDCAEARVSSFTAPGGASEYHVIVVCTDPMLDYDNQRRAVEGAFARFAATCPAAVEVMRRYFLSDPLNQAPQLAADGAVSMVGQTPLPYTKLAMWVYLAEGMERLSPAGLSPEGTVGLRPADDIANSRGMAVLRHGDYTHVYTSSEGREGEAYSQTLLLFDELCGRLDSMGGSLLDNCMRTWLYVRDIDLNYNQMVRGRNDVFAVKGLTPDTHYIASTGIGAEMTRVGAKVHMDSYSLIGHHPEQVRYISAPDHLNPTIEYGVAFERSTSIDYGDRRHVLVSGTASINNRGEIINLGDVTAQGHRALENVEALLANAGCSLSDIASAIVYVRDPADCHKVRALMCETLPDTPGVIVIGPVCRPGWLIEIECMAIAPASNPRWPKF